VYIAPLGGIYRLPSRVPKLNLDAARQLGFTGERTADTADTDTLPGLANNATLVLDRATRAKGWTQNRYLDEELRLGVELFDTNIPAEKNVERAMRITPRLGDVMKLVLAKVLEQGGRDRYNGVTLTLSDIARGLGLKPHPNGGVRSEDVEACYQHVLDLDSLWLVHLPDGSRTLQVGPPSMSEVQKPKRGRRLFALFGVDENEVDQNVPLTRQLNGQAVQNVFTLVVGDWINDFSEGYAPVFRSVVELPATNAVNLLVKSLTVELTFMFQRAQAAKKPLRLRVETLLTRAMMMGDVESLRKRRRVNEALSRFDDAMDKLAELGVIARWAYTPEGERAIRDAERGGLFDAWLTATVEIHPHARVLDDVGPPGSPPRS